MRLQREAAASAFIWLSFSLADAAVLSASPVIASSPIQLITVNTSAPAVNATVTTVNPPALLSSTLLTNVSLSSLGFSVGAAASQFNASFPVQAANATVTPLASHNTSIASLIPKNATQDLSMNNSNTLLIADPSWGTAIVVNASSLNSTQLVVSNTTSVGSTTVFTTVYNTTTVRLFVSRHTRSLLLTQNSSSPASLSLICCAGCSK